MPTHFRIIIYNHENVKSKIRDVTLFTENTHGVNRTDCLRIDSIVDRTAEV